MSKRLITVITLLFCAFGSVQAQQPSEKIKALKIAFFTERIGLSAEEAEIFWPLYNDYQERRQQLMRLEKSEVRDKIGAGGYSESQANTILKRYLELEEQQEELDKNFYQTLSERMSATKVLKLFQAEHEFRRRMLREYRNRRGQNGGHPIP